ncbi:hypothetical protein [Fastidiosibacter lacustris]|uniref:hypothetical protein n=1 Tax=Fastidiosibacter lacustris TaxID=2056695 RepID=UPI00195F02AE|nr:hypothetical protein [Fastidiosibacter lacustris]
MNIRPQYHFRRSKEGRLLIWDVRKLITQAQSLDKRLVKISDLTEVDECYWYEPGGDQPTCRSVTEHAKIIQESDLNYPIILCQQGKIMDGMHRVCKAMILGHKMIYAVQFKYYIDPDYIDLDPKDLNYD